MQTSGWVFVSQIRKIPRKFLTGTSSVNLEDQGVATKVTIMCLIIEARRYINTAGAIDNPCIVCILSYVGAL